MKKAHFAMAFHCYQPVFNFRSEFENAYAKAYLPLVKTLKKFPGVKATFHFSGNLLEWFERNHPEYIEILKVLVRRGQIELLGGGYFEPVMALIPERDKESQLRMNKEIIQRIFGVKPRGAWLTERVWEPSLADTLSSADVEYTIVDDHHILQKGSAEEKIFGPCRTKGSGGSLILFPALTHLRYSMPFRSASATLDYMKSITDKRGKEETCFFFADDGEKFGAWPYTYQLVHRKGWLRSFLSLLEENSDWLETRTYSDVVDNVPAEDVSEVPESSYQEMMKWSGGNFRNFLKKYAESDRMHKRMLSVSEDIEVSRCSGDDPEIKKAQKELFKAQTGCAYWHGTFGGLYLPHLRAGVYKHLIKAQNIIDAVRIPDGKYLRIEERDFGRRKREVVLSNSLVNIFTSPGKAGGVTEIDYKPLGVNLVNTMSRVKEDYHRKLKRTYSTKMKEAKKAAVRGDLIDIHDILGVKEKGLKKRLLYDDYERHSFLTRIYTEKCSLPELVKVRASYDSFMKGAYTSAAATDGEFATETLSRRDKIFTGKGRSFDIEVVKNITLGTGPGVMFAHKILNHSPGKATLKYAVEFNFLIWDKEIITKPRLTRADRFSLKDRYSGISLDFFLDGRHAVYR
ncbi:MAG: DUF1925 domain-containing protein, partial [Candidatus Omnitrophica bacterium]|nr:DUF1925 domain-containing protein [Candidatus Omnitrophota bacterium]